MTDQNEACMNNCPECRCAGTEDNSVKPAPTGTIQARLAVSDAGMEVVSYDLCNDGSGDNVLASLKAMGDAAVVFESIRREGYLNEDSKKPLAQYQELQGANADFDGAEVRNLKTGEVYCGTVQADNVVRVTRNESGGFTVVTSNETQATVITSLPVVASTSDLVSALESTDPVAVRENVTAVIEKAKETVRIGAVDKSFSPQDDLLLDRVIKALTTDGAEYPQLLNFIPALESQRSTLLGEAVAYRDAHARVMTHFWSMTMADVGNPATLAARAKIDITEVGNYNDDAWMQWWSETLRPWCITYGHLYGPDQEALETKNDTDGDVAAGSSVEES